MNSTYRGNVSMGPVKEDTELFMNGEVVVAWVGQY